MSTSAPGDAIPCIHETGGFVMTDDSPAFDLERPPALVLDRSVPEPEVVERHSLKFADQVTATLARRLDDVAEESAMLASAAEGVDLARGGVKLSAELRNRLAVQTLEDLDRGMQTLEFTIPVGSRVIAPPYDEEWSKGTGFAFGGKIDGKFTVAASDEPSSAAIGLYLSADQSVDVAITPTGTYSFACLAPQNLPALRSMGGLGLMVYVDNEAQPAYSREVTLWNLNGLSLATSVSGKGRIADAASPPIGLGPVYLAPLIIRMNPGRRYLMWMWGWQVSQQTQGFLGLLSVSMPLVTVDAGPPVIVK
jgi:hypothetical protein